MVGTPLGLSRPMSKVTDYGAGLQPVSVQMAQAFGEGDKAALTLGNHMQTIFAQATESLASGFLRAFGMADNLANRLIASLIEGFAQLGLGMLASSMSAGASTNIFTVLGAMLFSTKPGATPVNAIGTSARLGSSPALNTMISVVPIVNNTGLAVQVEIGNRVNARRRT
jgi:hypothetical protein